MRHLHWLCVCLFANLVTIHAAATHASEAPKRKPLPRFGISNVNLVTMDRETVLPDQNVVVEDGRIKTLGPAKEVAIPEPAQRIDGTGKFLMPGLCDMHVHLAPGIGNPDDPADRQMKLFLIHGVTTVRGMIGMPDHVQLRDRVSQGEVLGATIVCAGPPMLGGPVPLPDAAAQHVMQQSMQGFDFIKVHEGLSPESYQAIVDAAAKHRIPVAGHVTASVGLKRAMAARQTSIEHLDGYLRESIAADAAVKAPTGQFLFGPSLDHVQDAKLVEWSRATKEAGVWNTPTLSLFEMIASGQKANDLLQRPEMKFVPPGQLGHFTKQLEGASKMPATPAERARFIELRRKVVRSLNDAGAGLLVGSDSPQFFLVEGAATHHEIKSLVDAGLTPYQAIAAATCNPGQYLASVRGETRQTGTIATGNLADLLLLHKNPLEDVGHLRQIAGVIVRGHWLSADELKKLESELVDHAAQG